LALFYSYFDNWAIINYASTGVSARFSAVNILSMQLVSSGPLTLGTKTALCFLFWISSQFRPAKNGCALISCASSSASLFYSYLNPPKRLLGSFSRMAFKKDFASALKVLLNGISLLSISFNI